MLSSLGINGYYPVVDPPMVQIKGDKLYKKHTISPSGVTDTLLKRHVYHYERDKEIEIENGIVTLIWYVEDEDIESRLLALKTQHRTNYIQSLVEEELQKRN